jgi:hypothetical protein
MEKTESDKPFQLGKLVQNLTLDVIASVVLGHTINAQSTPDGEGVRGPTGVLTAFNEVQRNFLERGQISLRAINPMRMWRLWRYER